METGENPILFAQSVFRGECRGKFTPRFPRVWLTEEPGSHPHCQQDDRVSVGGVRLTEVQPSPFHSGGLMGKGGQKTYVSFHPRVLRTGLATSLGLCL